MRYYAANNAETTLAENINDTQTTFDVDDASVFPANTPFKISVGDEIMDVTGVATNTLTVERGAEDTTATSHSQGDRVQNRPTAGAWNDFQGDHEAHKSEKASQEQLGHIKVGENLNIQEDGTLDAEAGMEVHDNDYHDPDFATQEDIDDKFFDNAGAHNSIYRGKYLGDTYTSAQQSAVSAGTFEDMYIGDYWTIGGVNYRIAAFNYYYNTGDTALTDHHVTLVPDGTLYSHEMNDSNTTDGGYQGSKMYTEGLDTAKSTIDSAFGAANVVEHRKYLCNAVSDGEASGGSWYSSKVELMNEVMVFGCIVNGVSQAGDTNPQVGIEKTQLPLFSLRPDFANIGISYWLRDVVSASQFACMHGNGTAPATGAAASRGVRPAFSIKG